MTELIETRIREHYCAENGEWLVEKGKVKEAKLLKEACLTIEMLRKQNTNFWQNQHAAYLKNQELEKREKAVEESERRLRERMESVIRGLQLTLENTR